MTYYDVLELSATCTQRDIKQAYRRLAKKYHPDTNKSKKTTHFQLLSEAYQVLSIPEKRIAYDLLLLGNSTNITQERKTYRRPTPQFFRYVYEKYQNSRYENYNWKEQLFGFLWAFVILIFFGVLTICLIRYSSRLLYEEGMTLAEQGQIGAACYKLESSIMDFSTTNAEAYFKLAEINYYQLNNKYMVLYYTEKALETNGINKKQTLRSQILLLRSKCQKVLKEK